VIVIRSRDGFWNKESDFDNFEFFSLFWGKAFLSAPGSCKRMMSKNGV